MADEPRTEGLDGFVALRELRRALTDVARNVGDAAEAWKGLDPEQRRTRLEIVDRLVDLVPAVWRKFRATVRIEDP